jgi:DGQHR domain-containing protein
VVDEQLKVNALRVLQRVDAPLYVFGIEGRRVHEVAAVDEARRTDVGDLAGYQRARFESHIREIREYLEHPEALLPNAIVVAFGPDVTFEPMVGSLRPEWGTIGTLTIPTSKKGRGYRAGWIVDGQQRAAALERLPSDRGFPVVVVGFATGSAQVQREQFILVNRTKPLPRDLLVELLADVDIPLPGSLAALQISSRVVRILRRDVDSPFFGRVREIGERGQSTRISQAAIVEVVRIGMGRNGLLRQFVSPDGADTSNMAVAIASYYEGVRKTWPSAWSQGPWTSRLVHGVGIVALGRTMPVVAEGIDLIAPNASTAVAAALKPIAHMCAWSSGRWDGLGRDWWEFQNTAIDKKILALHLESLLRAARGQ